MAVVHHPGNGHLRAATYSERKVNCPNTSLLGYNKMYAERGDLIAYTYGEGTNECLGRVLGRVDAPFVPSSGDPKHDSPKVDGWIAVLELGMEGSHCYIRWIDPQWVRAIRRPSSTTFINWFFGDGPKVENVSTIITHSHYGSLSERAIEKYLDPEGRLLKDPNDAWEKKDG